MHTTADIVLLPVNIGWSILLTWRLSPLGRLVRVDGGQLRSWCRGWLHPPTHRDKTLRGAQSSILAWDTGGIIPKTLVKR